MLKLTDEQSALFALLQKSIKKNCNDEVLSKDLDWSAVREEALKQAVFLHVASQEEALCLSEEEKKSWENYKYRLVVSNMQSAYAIQEMNRVMRDNGFKYVILKGLAAASYYPNPQLRILGDVDFLIENHLKDEVINALETDGYDNWDTEHICHVVFKKPKQHLEMHFETVGIPDGVQGEYVREYMSEALQETVEFSLNERQISLPKSKYHGLILLLHMQHHMLSEGIGLRHLMDWCCFVDKTCDEGFWEKDLLPILKKIGLFKYARVITKTGALYFKTACPEWCIEADEILCDDVMNDILTGGNFGRKNAERSKSGMMISQHGKQGTRHGKVYNLFITLHNAVKMQHPVVKKLPFLYPLFYAFFALRRAFRVLTGKRDSLLKSVKYVNERKSVYERLEVFEI